MIFHATEFGTFDRCRRKAVLTSPNGQHLEPIFGTLSLSTGSIVHRAHQLWLRDTANEHDLEHHTMQASCEARDRAVANYQSKVGTEPDDSEMDYLYKSIEFCVSMARNYERMYDGQKLPDRYVLIKPEQTVRVRIKGTQHFLQGKLDAFILDRETNKPGVLERKTYGQAIKRRHLQRNQQYMCAYPHLLSELGLAEPEYAPFVLYDGLWRRHAPPKGRRFEDLFTRYLLQPTASQLTEFRRYLPMKANEMAFVYEHPHLAYPTIPWLGCSDCAFADEGAELCDAITANRQDLINYYTSTKFTTRTDDTAEEADA